MYCGLSGSRGEKYEIMQQAHLGIAELRDVLLEDMDACKQNSKEGWKIHILRTKLRYFQDKSL
jgi:hypothetical protein